MRHVLALTCASLRTRALSESPSLPVMYVAPGSSTNEPRRLGSVNMLVMILGTTTRIPSSVREGTSTKT